MLTIHKNRKTAYYAGIIISILGVFIFGSAWVYRRYHVGDFPSPAADHRWRGANTGRDTEYVDVWLGRTMYRLPTGRYGIWFQQYDRKKDHAAFGFDAKISDIAATYGECNEIMPAPAATEHGCKVRVLVEYGRNFISPNQMINNAFETAARMREADSNNYRHYDNNI